MWRHARIEEDKDIIRMCRELNREDPGLRPVPDEHMTNTLQALRKEPIRGRALALDLENLGATGGIQGYALLISFWSNELGGEVCTIDELYVGPEYRGKGHAQELVKRLISGEQALWPRTPVVLELEVTPKNARARDLYARLGFAPMPNTRMRYRFS